MYDLNVTGSAIADNNGRGIAAEKLRSSLHVHDTSVSNSNHVAGIHVLGGAADINITSSRISFNHGDGINVTVTGGNRNVSRTSISSNQGYGFAVWLNDSSSSEYVAFNQTTVVEYSEIFRNKDIGVLVSFGKRLFIIKSALILAQSHLHHSELLQMIKLPEK